MPSAVPAGLRTGPVTGARRLGKRGFRQADRRFLVEGPQAVGAALGAQAAGDAGTLLELFVTPAAADRHADVVARAGALGLPVHTVTAPVMAELAQTVTPQGLVAVARFRDVPLDAVTRPGSSPPRLVAVLAAVRDPGNAGTVLRVADAAGADAVVFSDASVDPYNAKCVRASAGSLFHVPFVVGAAVPAVCDALRAAHVRVIAAAGEAGDDIDAVSERGDLDGPTAWLFGNEAWGLPADVRALADAQVRVPIHGRAESLNLATAAAVCLYASARAQRRPGGRRRDGDAVS